MPIDVEEFESADAENLDSRNRPAEHEVLDFLAFNPELAYTRREINTEIDVTIFELASILSDLERDGLVRTRGSYWTITERGVKVSRDE